MGQLTMKRVKGAPAIHSLHLPGENFIQRTTHTLRWADTRQVMLRLHRVMPPQADTSRGFCLFPSPSPGPGPGPSCLTWVEASSEPLPALLSPSLISEILQGSEILHTWMGSPSSAPYPSSSEGLAGPHCVSCIPSWPLGQRSPNLMMRRPYL